MYISGRCRCWDLPDERDILRGLSGNYSVCILSIPYCDLHITAPSPEWGLNHRRSLVIQDLFDWLLEE